MAKVKLWPLVRKFYGHVKDTLYYVDWPRGRQTVTPDYFEYRKWRYNLKPRWPRGNFFIADRFWGAQSIEWRQKWKDAVKKPRLTPYGFWMKEALFHLNRNEYAPEEPSESGGWANPPLNPGERLKPCEPPPPKPPPHPPTPPGPYPPPEEPEEPEWVPCSLCESYGEDTPLYYAVEWQVWVLGTQYMCSWILLSQVEGNPCYYEFEHEVWGKSFRTNLNIGEMGRGLFGKVWRWESPGYWHPVGLWSRFQVGVEPMCLWAGELNLDNCWPDTVCDYFKIEDFGFEWPF